MKKSALSIRLLCCSSALALLAACSSDTEKPTAQSAAAEALAKPDAGLAVPDAGVGAGLPANPDNGLWLTYEFTGSANPADGTMTLGPAKLDTTNLTPDVRRRVEQGLCLADILQDGVPGSGPPDTVELVTNNIRLNDLCDPTAGVAQFCADVKIQSFYQNVTLARTYAQFTSITPLLGHSVRNSDIGVPAEGLASGLGIISYGDIGPAGSTTPADFSEKTWIFNSDGTNFTFTGRVLALQNETCNGVDDDCDERIDEGNFCLAAGQACLDSTDCATNACVAGLCVPAGCTDGTKNLAETDVDCGGATCGACTNGKGCAAHADCLSGYCDPVGDVCIPEPDSDSDGILELTDNCPLVSNANQLNTDAATDGGDACDDDNDTDNNGDVSTAVIHFAITNDDKVCDFEDGEQQQLKITTPYKPEYTTTASSSPASHKHSINRAFISPEFKEFVAKKTLPYSIHFKSGYYSFGLLCAHCFVSKTAAIPSVAPATNTTDAAAAAAAAAETTEALAPIINTKIYWFLKRVLHENPTARRYICL